MEGKRVIRSCSHLFTLFVDNIPDTKDQIWLERTFSNYGIVRDVCIPVKRSKKGSKFGFVRYDCSVAAGIAIYRANGLKVDGRHLHVKRASFELDNNKNDDIRKINGTMEECKKGEVTKQTNMEYRVVDRKSYAQAVKAIENHDIQCLVASIQIQPSGNGWLYRSAIAKIRKLLSTEELEKEFNLENVQDVHIKALGGRFVILTFPNEESRDATIKEKWVMNWFEEISPWNGESAKDERFAWLSCFGMPLNAWTMQTFKEIGGKWGHFIQMDDNTLRGKSYEKGRILIATEQVQKIEGKIELVVGEKRYVVRVKEENSFRKVAPIKSLIDLDLESEKGDADMAQNNVDELDGLVAVEARNDGGQSNKTKNNTEYGEGNRHVEDDNYSKVSKKAHLIEGKTSEECNEVSSNAEDIEMVAQSEKGNELGSYERGLQVDNAIYMKPVSSEKGIDDKIINYTSSSSSIDLSIVGSVEREPITNASNGIVEEFNGPILDQEKAAAVDSFADEIEDTQLSPVKAAINGVKRKKKRKTINDILGYSKVNSYNHKGGRNKQKCVVLRSAVAAAALSASISTDGIANRNRILLSEAQTIWEFNKMIGIGYEGDEDEVISKIAHRIAEEKDRASCHP